MENVIKRIKMEMFKKKKSKKRKKKDDYKIVISELGISPFSVLKAAFALMGIIPILILFIMIRMCWSLEHGMAQA